MIFVSKVHRFQVRFSANYMYYAPTSRLAHAECATIRMNTVVWWLPTSCPHQLSTVSSTRNPQIFVKNSNVFRSANVDMHLFQQVWLFGSIRYRSFLLCDDISDTVRFFWPSGKHLTNYRLPRSPADGSLQLSWYTLINIQQPLNQELPVIMIFFTTSEAEKYESNTENS